MQLICSFDQWLAPNYPAYLVRIYNDRTREVDIQMHSSQYPGASLLYDVSMNVIYWTVWKSGPLYKISEGQKVIRKVWLDAR